MFEWLKRNKDFKIKKGVLMAYKGTSKEVVIPDGVTEIAVTAFWGNRDITDIWIPDSVESISNKTFLLCK